MILFALAFISSIMSAYSATVARPVAILVPM
nr:MAG TPA: hypothetical protein [Caudoviricetes sp.]